MEKGFKIGIRLHGAENLLARLYAWERAKNTKTTKRESKIAMASMYPAFDTVKWATGKEYKGKPNTGGLKPSTRIIDGKIFYQSRALLSWAAKWKTKGIGFSADLLLQICNLAHSFSTKKSEPLLFFKSWPSNRFAATQSRPIRRSAEDLPRQICRESAPHAQPLLPRSFLGRDPC